MTIRGKPNVDDFLNGAAITAPSFVAKVPPPPSAPAAERRVQKIYALPESLVLDVERRCTDERAIRGRRVTQREVVEGLLRKWVKGEIAI